MSRYARVGVLVVTLTGCDLVFSPAGRPLDAGGDALTPDADRGPDEDGDTVLNDVDNCPVTANLDQMDAQEGPSGDRIGDVCDPHPALLGDVQLELFSFDTPATDEPRWNPNEPIGDNWEFEKGIVDHKNILDTNALLTLDVPVIGPATIDAGFTFHGWGSQSRIGIRIDADNGEECFVQPAALVAVDRIATGGTAASIVMPGLTDGAVLHMRAMRRTNDNLLCSVVVVGVGKFEAPEVASTGNWPINGQIGIRARTANVALRYVVVYE